MLSASAGVSGSFNYVTIGSFGPLIKPKLTYDANDVFLLLALSHVTSLLPNTSTANQKAVTLAIDTAADAGADLPPVFQNLGNLAPSALATDATQLSGEPASDLPQAGMAMLDPFLMTMIDRFSNLGSDLGTSGAAGIGFTPQVASLPGQATNLAAFAAPRPAQPSNGLADIGPGHLWASIFGGRSQTNGDASSIGSHDVEADTIGVIAGFDLVPGRDSLIGAALAYGQTTFKLGNDLGTGKSNGTQIGLYGTKRFNGKAYISVGGVYAWHDMSTSRFVTVSGTDHLTADFSAKNYGGRIEGGYLFALPAVDLTPYAALQTEAFHTPSYNEAAASGSSAFALSYISRTATTTRTELGASLAKVFEMEGNTPLRLFGRAAWVHASSSDQVAHAAFETLPGSGFTVHGADPLTEAALISFGAQIRASELFSFGTRIERVLSGRATTYFGTATLNYSW